MTDEINDTTLLGFPIKNKQIIILCQICLQIPYIKIYFDNKNQSKIKIKCKCSNYKTQIINPDDFLLSYIYEFDLTRHNNLQDDVNYVKQFKCYQHINCEIYAYCEECKEHLCYQCYMKHCQVDKIKPKKLSSYYTQSLYNEKLTQFEAVKSKFPLEKQEIIDIVDIIINNFNFFKENLNYVVITNFLNNTIFNDHYNLYHTHIVRNSFIDCISTINEHKEKVVTLMKLSDDSFASSALDYTIKIFEKKNKDEFSSDYICVNSLKIKGKYAKCMCKINNFSFISFCDNGIVNIWELKGYTSIFEKECDFGQFIDVFLFDNEKKFILSSYDYSVQIWNLPKMELETKVIIKDYDYIKAIVLLYDKRLVTCGEDGEVKFWDVKRLKVIKTVYEIECSYEKSAIQLKNGNLGIGGDAVVSIIDVRSYRILKRIMWDYGRVRTLVQIEEDSFLCSLDLFEMRQIDICKNSITKITEGHDDKVFSLIVLDYGTIVSASLDTKIKIWK